MGSIVKAHCSECNETYTYVFGLVQDLMPYQTFLNLYAKKQKDLFSEDIFKEVLYDELETDIMFMLKDKEEQEEILNRNYKNVLNFFSEEEKKLIKSNILLSGEIESYPVFRLDSDPSKREIYNVPLVKLKFMNADEYTRTYNPYVYYVQFTEEHDRLTCPRHGKLTAELVSEKDA
ncbi:hypothetical protein [Mycoplasmopsis verecunda]|uniref:Uncharacterized protein n=1 Tax=Mycoplasmopsis verecunda TaxID=171291 RepID=A0A1T4LIK8_9BACT|nr:hypothetical protein [Mycoplasmopsis verecunda]WPB54605.1 hypothetical protein SAM46_00340 [Mycoplasmopsis verecunda]SJZ54224.1 hypothetical protein SAMN02745154_00457 [Mycoplasmopsis verecunda]